MTCHLSKQASNYHTLLASNYHTLIELELQVRGVAGLDLVGRH